MPYSVLCLRLSDAAWCVQSNGSSIFTFQTVYAELSYPWCQQCQPQRENLEKVARLVKKGAKGTKGAKRPDFAIVCGHGSHLTLFGRPFSREFRSSGV